VEVNWRKLHAAGIDRLAPGPGVSLLGQAVRPLPSATPTKCYCSLDRFSSGKWAKGGQDGDLLYRRSRSSCNLENVCRAHWVWHTVRNQTCRCGSHVTAYARSNTWTLLPARRTQSKLRLDKTARSVWPGRGPNTQRHGPSVEPFGRARWQCKSRSLASQYSWALYAS